jgi:hypothetical protein
VVHTHSLETHEVEYDNVDPCPRWTPTPATSPRSTARPPVWLCRPA